MRYLQLKLNNKGVALIATFLVITVLLGFSAVFISSSINQNIIADISTRRAKAFYLAESGLDNAIYSLRINPNNTTINQAVAGGFYNVTITDLGVSGNIQRYRVNSNATFGSMRRALVNTLQVDNYARYLWFTDSETYDGSTVWFWTQDHLNGPTQTNGHFNIYGNPVFGGEARSVDDYIRFYNNGNNVNLQQTTNNPWDLPDFQSGMVFETEHTNMTSQAQSVRAAASSGGFSLSGNTVVVFNTNGTMNVTNSKKSWNNANMALPANGALFVVNGTLTVSGVVNGSVTVGASKDIIIPGNITYANDPRINSTSDDVLGIISESDVLIDDHASNNLTIQSCIMAMGTSFMLNNYADADAKGNLTVYGGIIQDERGPVGTFNAGTGEKVSGYSKNYLYDSRLMVTPPPYMPNTGDYITMSWQED